MSPIYGLILFGVLASPGKGEGREPGTSQSVSCAEHTRAVRFLELLKASHNPKSVGFRVKEGLPLDTRAVLDFLAPAGVRFQDVNDKSDVVVPFKVLQKALGTRKGRYYRTLVHLGHIYGQPYPQYSTLKCSVRDGQLRIDVAAWYSVTLSEGPDSVKVAGIQYLQVEDL
jgi:hypothetical protein